HARALPRSGGRRQAPDRSRAAERAATSTGAAARGQRERSVSPEPDRYPRSGQLLADLRTEFPSFRIVPKRHDLLSHAIDGALKLVTLGAQRRYLTHYHTVIGYTLYVPPGWATMSDVARVILLRHERVHLRQRRRYGFVLFAFLYLVPFLSRGTAYCRDGLCTE